MKNGNKRLAKNAAGYLVPSIRDDYAPEGYIPPDEADRLAEAEAPSRRDRAPPPRAEAAEADRHALHEADLRPDGPPSTTTIATRSPRRSRPTTPASAAGRP